MVKINNKMWITPTTYGSVLTHITDTQHFERIYLDNEATTKLCSEDYSCILKEIKKKNIAVDNFSDYKHFFCNEKNQCDTLAHNNNWILFSYNPLQFSVQTINYCNAHCDFCYANAPNASNRKIMNFSLIKTLKDYAANNGVKFGVSGGEPLLHPSIYEILSYRNEDVFDTLITNLTAPVDLDKLIRTKVDLIQISLHGYDTIHNNIIKIDGAYEKIFERIKYLFPSVNLGTNTVITPNNIESIPQLIQDLSDIQKECNNTFTYVRFVPVVPSGAGIDTYTVKQNFFDDVEHLLRSLKSEYDDLNFEIPLIHANPYEYKKIGDRWMCPAGSTVAVIRLDGRIVPCNQFLDTTFSSTQKITDSSFQQIWLHDSLFSKFRQGMVATKHKNCEECLYLIMKE